jgi:hypothetical protein
MKLRRPLQIPVVMRSKVHAFEMLESVWSWIRIPLTARITLRPWDRLHPQSKSPKLVYGFKKRPMDSELLRATKRTNMQFLRLDVLTA